MNCPKCGLPVFDGATGYVGPQCICRWNTGTVVNQLEEIEKLREQLVEAKATVDLENTRVVTENGDLRLKIIAAEARIADLKEVVEQSKMVCRTHGIAFPTSCITALAPTDNLEALAQHDKEVRKAALLEVLDVMGKSLDEEIFPAIQRMAEEQ